MLKIIEGCTCAGKSTLMHKLCEDGAYLEAPEHTPPRLTAGEDLLQRQWEIFSDFLGRCLELQNDTKHTYVADFSPLGCIAFNRALAVYTGNKWLEVQAREMARICKAYHWDVIQYLEQPVAVIESRLKERGRDTDDVWSHDFLLLLIDEYNKIFVRGEI